MTPRVLPAAALLALGACAAGTQQIVSPRAERLEPGATYRVEVENRTGCPASVRFGETTISRGMWIGTVPAHGEDTFMITPPRRGGVAVYALEEDGHMCDHRLDDPVRVTVTRQVAVR